MTGDDYLPSIYQQVIAKSRYSRWRDDLGRREYWSETVDRYIENLVKHIEEAAESDE